MSTTTASAPASAPPRSANAPAGTAGVVTTVSAVAVRTGLKILRRPQILGIAVLQSVLFLLMFRYVLGGSIGGTSGSYVDYFIPGFVVVTVLFNAGGGAVAVAEESAAGLYDRLRSLPIPDVAVLAGRALADAALVFSVAMVTLGVGFAVGFRSSADPAHWAAAVALLVLVSVTIGLIFVWIGLASGSAQAANGLGLLSVPFSFLSSAFVPIQTMPAVVQAFAEWQPLTFLTDSWRGLLLGTRTTSTLGHPLSFYIVGSVIWCVILTAVAAPLALRSYRKD
ncbi:ABC transporter permease [Allobranchiibius huperziae]|uniref:Transport permease protein n=1 Tax=Allobranchiibius huperziae TaxID=1874116 RepID=A0A853DLC3_9MICO|nr:ABC transporter permease [Allobranchiibius huperziae]NYJ75450.1 ABC transporter DrrB family efflux protein [Allobranchiibius huperziae]